MTQTGDKQSAIADEYSEVIADPRRAVKTRMVSQ
jgi:hypothetical protein